MKLFGSSGTRGVVGEGITPELVLQVAKAAGTVWEANQAIIARDTRTSSQSFVNAAVSGLTSVGIDVIRLGVTPTPSVVHYAGETDRPGIVITASHNPPEYNGVKLIGETGVEIGVEGLERIEACVLNEDFTPASWDNIGSITRTETVNTEYVDKLLTALEQDGSREAIADANLTVAIDPGHGAGCLTSPQFFRKLGCDVVTVNATPDGHFPGRPSEPIASNLTALRSLVTASNADIGIAHDGDADRAVFIDEQGKQIAGEASLAALAAAELDSNSATVAAVNVSQRLVDVCNRVGATLELTPIGSTNIITRIQELQKSGVSVPVAGEGNGGIFFPKFRLVRDGAYNGAKFLRLICEQPASSIIEPYTKYANARINIEHGSEKELEALMRGAEEFAEEADVTPNIIDGYRLDYDDAWVLIRPSGTEPVVRVYAEAKEQTQAQTLADDAAGKLYDATDDIG